MAGLFASMAVKLGLDKLSSLLPASLTSPPTASSSSSSATQDLEDLRSLERTMRRIRAMLHDAEEHWNIREESAKLRLEELKEVAYDAEDVVDEYEYEVNLCELEALGRSASVESSNNKRKRLERNGTSAIDTGTVAVPNELVVRAMKIIKRYDEIIKDYGNLALSENDGERRFAPGISSLREVGSDVCERSILGREHDKDSIVEKLLSREDDRIGNRISVQAIVGMGGLGKTTLAQLVYNDPRVSQSFDKLAWVCVSEQFDVSNITRKIIMSLTKNKCDVTELANLQGKLLDEIKEQKVLLVLDDVWNERDSWERLCTPLSKTRVCKVIVTTRSEVVANLVRTMPFYRINILSSDDSWSLFKQVAFAVHQENDTPRTSRKGNEAYSFDAATVSVPKELAVQTRKIIERFNEIKDYSDNFTLSENDGEKRFAPDISSIRKTSSVVFEKSILGRAQDKNEVVEKLLSREGDSTTSPVSVLAIVGMGGLGKTTLAQLVYNDPRVHQSFDKHAWVCVSEQFDISSITRSIISSLTKDRCDLSELGNLQERLVDGIKEKRVLLVLDDVWNERSDCWDSLCMPMMTTRLCKIVVTTRNEAVARLVQTMPLHRLNRLSFDESWSLFNQVAFAVHQENDTPANLIEIGKSIVKKCKGLPLAIKTLASMLRYETDEMRWRYVLESQLWNLEQSQNEVLPALKLSYKHMPVHLKRCFVALSLFPKDHFLFADKVLHLWKILDLLQCDGSNDEDEIGLLYFKDLVQRSFLEACFVGATRIMDDTIHIHTMHDLIHDLACFLAGEEFFRLEGDTPIEIPRNARYVSIPEAHTSVEISNASHSVRAIIVLRNGNLSIIQNPEALFLHCKKLRALSLGQSMLAKALPDNMGSLKLLRHLEVDNNRGEPTTSGIRHLINLHRLPPIHMSRCDCNYNIRELRKLNKIRKLRIVRWGSPCLIEDANEAQLLNKRHLHSLDLDFRVMGQSQYCPHSVQTEPVTVTHEQLLDSLRPHDGLRELRIMGYESQKYPNWLGNASFYNLTKIKLDMNKSQHVPTLGMLPSLKSLEFWNMYYVQRIGREFCSLVPGMKGFRSLTRLEFCSMPEWSEWSGVYDGDFPCLHTLVISGAAKLRSLPWAPLPSLVTLNLFCVNLATVPAWPTLRELRISGAFEAGGLNELGTLPSLLKLELRECPNLSAVGSLPSLTTLSLHDRLPPDETLHRLLNCHPSLECVTIICRSTACIRLDPQGLPSLRKLRLSCENLQYCDGIAGLTCLKELKLWGCPKLPVHSLLLPRQLQNPDIRDEPACFSEDFDRSW